MKFISLLLKEGRKEDLKKKYSKKFDEQTLDWILNISDLADFNHKYTDWILKTIDPETQDVDIVVDVSVDLVKDFDKYQSQLEKKDLNQYKDLVELESKLSPFKHKEELKKLESQIDKVYEDEKFLVIKPKTEESSCKYGSSTKWCVTQKGSGHFKRYTTGGQLLYFIINKKNSTDQNYSKVAVHFDNSGDASYWDSRDNKMNDREIQVLNYAFPEIHDAISKDYEAQSLSKADKFLQEVFSDWAYEQRSIENYLSSDNNLTVDVTGFRNIYDMGPGHAEGNVSIGLKSPGLYEKLDEYKIYFTYESNIQDKSTFFVQIRFAGEEGVIDLGLEDHKIDTYYHIGNSSPNTIAKQIRSYVAGRVLNQVHDNPKLTERFIGNSKVWRPNRINYGYTFGKNKGLIKKLVDWLDNDNTVGTKLDFLVDIGKLERKSDDNNNPIYRIKGTNHNWRTSGDLRGHFAGFFASAKNAGILSYRKSGGKYLLVQGPNFEAFKKGELKAL
jgi:hypothetical protein